MAEYLHIDCEQCRVFDINFISELGPRAAASLLTAADIDLRLHIEEAQARRYYTFNCPGLRGRPAHLAKSRPNPVEVNDPLWENVPRRYHWWPLELGEPKSLPRRDCQNPLKQIIGEIIFSADGGLIDRLAADLTTRYPEYGQLYPTVAEIRASQTAAPFERPATGSTN